MPLTSYGVGSGLGSSILGVGPSIDPAMMADLEEKKKTKDRAKAAEKASRAEAFAAYQKAGGTVAPTYGTQTLLGSAKPPTAGAVFQKPTFTAPTGVIGQTMDLATTLKQNKDFEKFYAEFVANKAASRAPATFEVPGLREVTRTVDSPDKAERAARTEEVAKALKGMESEPLTFADIGQNITGFGPRMAQYLAANRGPSTVSYDLVNGPEGGFSLAPATVDGGILDRILASRLSPGTNVNLRNTTGLALNPLSAAAGRRVSDASTGADFAADPGRTVSMWKEDYLAPKQKVLLTPENQQLFARLAQTPEEHAARNAALQQTQDALRAQEAAKAWLAKYSTPAGGSRGSNGVK